MKTRLAQAVLAVQLTPADVMWPLPLIVEYLDGDTWRLRERFLFHSPAEDVFPSLEIPAGFVTNFASIPRFFWRVISPTDARIGKASIGHDYSYLTPAVTITREAADKALRAGMEALGASAFERETCYAVIRLFGRGFLPRTT